MFLFLLLYFLPLSQSGSVPVTWTSSSYFKAGNSVCDIGSFSFASTGNGSFSGTYYFPYDSALTAAPTQFVALGIIDFEMAITLRQMQI